MDAEAWDSRYADTPLLWSAGPNTFLEREVAGLRPGRALDLAAGEGRNALWLAEQGWEVTAVDFSAVAIERGRERAARAHVDVEWVAADVTGWDADTAPFDLVIVFYLQLPEAPLTAALSNAASALAPGGTFLAVGHDRDNLEHGVGGPSDPAVLWTAQEIADLLEGHGLQVQRAEQVQRTVDTDEGSAVAVDCLVRAIRPSE